MKIRSWRFASFIVFFMALTAIGIYAQPVNLERLFNAGLNYGWLVKANQTGMFPHMWATYANDGAAEYNNAFFPPRNYHTPEATYLGATLAIQYIQRELSGSHNVPAALGIFKAGVDLAVAHIEAQRGRCPDCLGNSMFSAGSFLQGCGRNLNLPALLEIGRSLMNEQRNMGYRTPPDRMPPYINILANTIMNIQRLL